MAKGKSKNRKTRQPEVEAKPKEPAAPIVEADPERFGALEYLAVNMILWVFCVINFYVASYFMGETTGLYFFFGVMALGFTAACLISYLHDRFYVDDLAEKESP